MRIFDLCIFHLVILDLCVFVPCDSIWPKCDTGSRFIDDVSVRSPNGRDNKRRVLKEPIFRNRSKSESKYVFQLVEIHVMFSTKFFESVHWKRKGAVYCRLLQWTMTTLEQRETDNINQTDKINWVNYLCALYASPCREKLSISIIMNEWMNDSISHALIVKLYGKCGSYWLNDNVFNCWKI